VADAPGVHSLTISVTIAKMTRDNYREMLGDKQNDFAVALSSSGERAD